MALLSISLTKYKFRCFLGLGQSVPTTIAVSESLNLLSIGFNNGAILLLRGDITKDRGTKMKLIIEPDQVATITGLSFKLASFNFHSNHTILL
jgi:hypothetical protein